MGNSVFSKQDAFEFFLRCAFHGRLKDGPNGLYAQWYGSDQLTIDQNDFVLLLEPQKRYSSVYLSVHERSWSVSLSFSSPLSSSSSSSSASPSSSDTAKSRRLDPDEVLDFKRKR